MVVVVVVVAAVVPYVYVEWLVVVVGPRSI